MKKLVLLSFIMIFANGLDAMSRVETVAQEGVLYIANQLLGCHMCDRRECGKLREFLREYKVAARCDTTCPATESGQALCTLAEQAYFDQMASHLALEHNVNSASASECQQVVKAVARK